MIDYTKNNDGGIEISGDESCTLYIDGMVVFDKVRRKK
jgi:hypothetical protein